MVVVTSKIGSEQPKTNGRRNIKAGHNWELEIVKTLKALGFLDVVTTRSNSRLRDNQKVDIMNKDERKNGFLPFNIQAKIIARNISYQTILAEMPKGEHNVIAFKETRKSGTRFRAQGTYAIMYLDTFYHYIQIEQEYNKLLEKNKKK